MIQKLNGRIDGKHIELERDAGLPAGTPVSVQIEIESPPVELFRKTVDELCGSWEDESLDAIFAEILRERETRTVRPVPDFDAPA
jgi:hypothetical protein